MSALTSMGRRTGSVEPSVEALPESGGEELDVRDLLRTLWRRRWVIFGTMVILTGLAALVTFQLTPRYTATARVMIDPRQQQVVDIESVIAGANPDAALIASEVETLQSRALAERVITELGLAQDPEFNGGLREQPAWRGLLRPSAWIPASWLEVLAPTRDIGPPPDAETARRLELAGVIDGFLGRLTVSAVGRSLVIDVAFVSEDPFKAAEIANQIADFYLVSQLEAKFEATARANAWLNERLTDLREQVEASERAIVAYRQQYNIADTELTDVATQQISELNTQLTLARAERAASEARLAQVRGLVRRGGAESAAEVLSSRLIQSLREEEASLQRELSELLTRYGERHPRIINARAEIGDLRTSIEREVTKILQNLENELGVSRARERALEDDLQRLKVVSNESRSAEIRLAELERVAEANRELYGTFLNRFKETSEQEEIQQPDARVISRADVPLGPSFPRKNLIVAAAFAGSLVLGVGLVILLERLDNGFRTGEQIRAETGLATLALVPLLGGFGKRSRPDQIVLDKPFSQFTEAVRTLLAGILLSDIDRPPRTVLMTSALPGEGKTLTALSLARVAAQGGRRTLLVDCDVRRPSLKRLVQPETADPGGEVVGLTDVLTHRVELAEATFTDAATGLTVLLSGSRVPNPQDLLQSQTFRSLLDQLAQQYELVVIDAPPVMAVADSLTLGALADRTVFVTQWEKTPRNVAVGALRQLAQNKAHLAGVVLSQVHARRHARYGSGDSGYYYGRYREYYQD